MLGSGQSPEALPGLHAMLLRQQGTESLVCQQQHGTLHRQLGHKVMVASWKWPNAQLAGCSGVRLCRVQGQVYLHSSQQSASPLPSSSFAG